MTTAAPAAGSGRMGEQTGRRELALACLDYLDVEPDLLVRTAADAGFDSVTLRVAGSIEAVRGDLEGGAGRRARVRQALADTGLRVLDVEVVRMNPGLADDEVDPVVEVAAELGARHLLVVNSGLERAAAADRLARIVELCEGTGVRPCLEPMPFSRCRTLDDGVSTAVPTGAGVLVDALHLQRSGGSPGDVELAIARHGVGLFPYVQICDAPTSAEQDPARLREEAVRRRLLPGKGELPLVQLLSVLPPYLPLAVEAPSTDLAHESPARRAALAMQAVQELLSWH